MGTMPKGTESSNVSPHGHVQTGCGTNQAYPVGIGDKAAGACIPAHPVPRLRMYGALGLPSLVVCLHDVVLTSVQGDHFTVTLFTIRSYK